jgi:hypothetical protein
VRGSKSLRHQREREEGCTNQKQGLGFPQLFENRNSPKSPAVKCLCFLLSASSDLTFNQQIEYRTVSRKPFVLSVLTQGGPSAFEKPLTAS